MSQPTCDICGEPATSLSRDVNLHFESEEDYLEGRFNKARAEPVGSPRRRCQAHKAPQVTRQLVNGVEVERSEA